MIRRAELKDAYTIHKLLQSILKLHHDLYPERFSGTSKYSLEQITTMIESESLDIFVYDQDSVLGYIISERKDTYLYIDDLCVDENARGQAIGQQLVKRVLEQAKTLQIPEVQLNVWNKNVAAIRFYEALDFEPLRTILVKKLT